MFWSWLLILTGCLERDMAEREPAPGVTRQLWQWHSCCGSCNQETWSHWNWHHGKLTLLLLTQWLDNSNMCSKYSVECWSSKATSFCKESGIWHLEAGCLLYLCKWTHLGQENLWSEEVLVWGQNVSICLWLEPLQSLFLQEVFAYKMCPPTKGAHLWRVPINIGVVQKVGKCYSLDKSLSGVKVLAKQCTLFTG